MIENLLKNVHPIQLNVIPLSIFNTLWRSDKGIIETDRKYRMNVVNGTVYICADSIEFFPYHPINSTFHRT